MKLITQLNGTVTEGDYREPRGAVQSLYLEPTPGVHIQITLGAAGLVYSRGGVRVAIPLEDLNTLVSQHVPELSAVEETSAAAAKNAVLAFAQQMTAKPTPPDVKRDA